MIQYILDEQLFPFLIVTAILLTIIHSVRGRFWEGKPKGPDYSRRGHEFWYDPNRDLSSKLLLFALNVLGTFLLMLVFLYAYGKYDDLF